MLNVAESYFHWTGNDPNTASEQALQRGLIESVSFPKIDFLFKYYGSDPLKYWAVAIAANQISKLDIALGGAGRADWTANEIAWVSGPVLDYYFNNLTSLHYLTSLRPLQFVQQTIDNVSGDNSTDPAFFQRLANAYTFQVQLAVFDTGDGLTITAGGTVTISGYPVFTLDQDVDYPISGSNVVNYGSGSYGTSNPVSLQLPLSYPQWVTMLIDGCKHPQLDVYMNDVGSLNEIWGPYPPPSPTYASEDYLNLDFDAAFQQYSALELDPNFSDDWLFPIPATGATSSRSLSGTGIFVAHDVVNLQISIQHTPQ